MFAAGSGDTTGRLPHPTLRPMVPRQVPSRNGDTVGNKPSGHSPGHRAARGLTIFCVGFAPASFPEVLADSTHFVRTRPRSGWTGRKMPSAELPKRHLRQARCSAELANRPSGDRHAVGNPVPSGCLRRRAGTSCLVCQGTACALLARDVRPIGWAMRRSVVGLRGNAIRGRTDAGLRNPQAV
jgi:hypothetical protein